MKKHTNGNRSFGKFTKRRGVEAMNTVVWELVRLGWEKYEARGMAVDAEGGVWCSTRTRWNLGFGVRRRQPGPSNANPSCGFASPKMKSSFLAGPHAWKPERREGSLQGSRTCWETAPSERALRLGA